MPLLLVIVVVAALSSGVVPVRGRVLGAAGSAAGAVRGEAGKRWNATRAGRQRWVAAKRTAVRESGWLGRTALGVADFAWGTGQALAAIVRHTVPVAAAGARAVPAGYRAGRDRDRDRKNRKRGARANRPLSPGAAVDKLVAEGWDRDDAGRAVEQLGRDTGVRTVYPPGLDLIRSTRRTDPPPPATPEQPPAAPQQPAPAAPESPAAETPPPDAPSTPSPAEDAPTTKPEGETPVSDIWDNPPPQTAPPTPAREGGAEAGFTVPAAAERLLDIRAQLETAGEAWIDAAAKARQLLADVNGARWTTSAITEAFGGLTDAIGETDAITEEHVAWTEGLAVCAGALDHAITGVGDPAAAHGATGDVADFQPA